MAKRTIYLLSSLAFFILIPVVAIQAQLPPHDSSNGIVCRDCHYFAQQNGILTITVPKGAEQETVCKSCHNPDGQASSMSSVGNHLVNGGDTIIDCGSCHNPHRPDTTIDPHTGTEADNLSLIRNKTRHVEGALDLAIFQQRPEHFAFDEGNEPWNGICQTCHTQTNHHTNDATADHQHEAGSDCLTCHSHQAGFAASGGDCVGCHSNSQGSRRAVVAEFPVDNIHAHYGTALDEASCLVCHSVDTHMDGYVELVDPDDGSIYRFMSPGDLDSDPDLSNFCANCHDDDGAQRLAAPLDPFGNGNMPPDVATQFLGTLQWDEWYGDFCFGSEGTLRQVNSHHDISDSDQAWSGAKIECLNCHGAHNSSSDTPIADPSNQAQIWTGEINDFCLTCHYGGNGPLDPLFPIGLLGPDVVGPMVPMRGLDTGSNCTSYNLAPWWVDYTWTYSPHGLDSKRYWGGYPNLPNSDAVLDCTVCHDPHGSYTATNTLGNPYMIRDFVDGTPFIDDGNRPNPSTWNPVPGTSGSVVVTISGTSVDWGSEDSLCIKCHATWLESYSWHSYCNGCQTCHNHGQSWDGYDWGPGNDDDTNCGEIGGTSSASVPQPEIQSNQASSAHQGDSGQSCSECHESHF
jgi:hypothetical protein